ncbi:MAG: YggT family protein [Frankiaceae bacterium]|jgi:YggT family protein
MAYVILLFGRFVFDLIVTINRGFRPSGPLLVVAEVVYTATDPPLRLLRRWIPPLRIGSVAIDLGFTLLLIILLVLASQVRQL